MKKNYTHISILLDKSGSMGILINDTIGGFNSLVEDQKKEEGEATLSLFQFANSLHTTYEFKDIQQVEKLSKETYKPSGGTALYDSLSEVIDRTGEELRLMSERSRPSKVLIVAITDGEENASSRVTAQALKAKIEHQSSKYNWEFVFLGSNQDAVLNARRIGIAPTHAYTYDNSHEGVVVAFAATSSNVSKLRKGKDIDFSDTTGDLNG